MYLKQLIWVLNKIASLYQARLTISRSFSITTSILKNEKFLLNRQSKFMDKMLQKLSTRRQRNKRGIEETKQHGYSIGFPRMETNKRLLAISKTYHNIIAEALECEDMSLLFTDVGVQITHVEISPNLSSIQVFWVTRLKLNGNELDGKLAEAGRFIRKYLVNEGTFSQVPVIKFVKNKLAFIEMEVDERLACMGLGVQEESIEQSEREPKKFVGKLNYEQIYTQIKLAKQKGCTTDILSNKYAVLQISKLHSSSAIENEAKIGNLREFLKQRRLLQKKMYRLNRMNAKQEVYSDISSDAFSNKNWENSTVVDEEYSDEDFSDEDFE